jgi:hypothetical protein
VANVHQMIEEANLPDEVILAWKAALPPAPSQVPAS